MKNKIAFTEEAKIKVLVFFEANLRNKIANEAACIEEAYDRACNSDTFSHYEMSGLESKSRNPEIIEFLDSDFIYEENKD